MAGGRPSNVMLLSGHTYSIRNLTNRESRKVFSAHNAPHQRSKRTRSGHFDPTACACYKAIAYDSIFAEPDWMPSVKIVAALLPAAIQMHVHRSSTWLMNLSAFSSVAVFCQFVFKA